MSVTAAITLTAAAAQVLESPTAKKVIKGAASVFSTVDRINSAGGAITAISRQTSIISRSFIDEAILDEPVLAGLNRSIHGWYVAQIVAAMGITDLVDGKNTVQDLMAPLQTGSVSYVGSVVDRIATKAMGLETFLGTEDLMGVPSSKPASAMVPSGSGSGSSTRNEDIREKTVTDGSVSMKSIKVADNRIGPMGELYDLKLRGPAGVVNVPIFIQIQPSVIPAKYAPRFIDMNVLPSLWQRWTQMTAGEIGFWKDFLAQADLRKRNQSIIKDPEAAHAFSDFLKTVNRKDAYAIQDASGYAKGHSHNLANSVMILSQDAVAQAKADSGIDLHNPADRGSYFKNTYSMIIAIVDPLHQRVSVYINGIDGYLNLSYSDFKNTDGKNEGADFVAALQAISTNSIGRMR